jgi:hypothetical protein
MGAPPLTSLEHAHRNENQHCSTAHLAAKIPHKPPHFDFSQLINRVGLVLVVDFTQSALAHRNLSIAMWRVLAVLSNDGGQRSATNSREVVRLTVVKNCLRRMYQDLAGPTQLPLSGVVPVSSRRRSGAARTRR